MVDPRILIIHNPAAGRRHAHQLVSRVAHGLSRAGRRVEIARTDGPGSATILAARAVADGVPLVVAAGGDGTINEVLQPLVGGETALGVLPVGTVNVWAAETGIPSDADRLAALLLRGAARRVDVGCIGARYFLLMASVGVDAAVVRQVGGDLKRLIGRWAYLAAFSGLLWRHRGSPVVLRLDDREVHCTLLMLVIGNTRRYAGTLRATPHAVVDDGRLDVLAIRGDHVWRSLPRAGALVSSLPILRAKLLTGRASTIEVVSSVALPIQVDGDFAGFTPVTVRAVPRGLSVIVGAGNAGGLFACT